MTSFAAEKVLRWAILLSAACTSFVEAQAPIPDIRNSGYQLSKSLSCSQGPGFRVEIFGDFQRPDTKAFWNNILHPLLAEQRYTLVGTFVFHAFPLPYHRSGFTSAQAIRVVTKHLADPTAFVKVAGAFFSEQQRFQTDVTANLSDSSIFSDVFWPIVSKFGMSRSDFLKGMADESINSDVRVAWKMGCSRGISGTPAWALNGVTSDEVGQWNITQWKSWLDTQLPSKFLQV
eukprot:TRINITY_DN92547_c0_g1_i1.p1 TRINITY_DN92547_c0_g1~~TRINITY_DN92547_c0_g1_i1.p1  ORF type:complete len:232 (-),score=30.54 TRINITY_DN92547_c0_g1_i1:88-783(-)